MKKDTNQNLVEALDEVITERSVFEVLKQQKEITHLRLKKKE